MSHRKRDSYVELDQTKFRLFLRQIRIFITDSKNTTIPSAEGKIHINFLQSMLFVFCWYFLRICKLSHYWLWHSSDMKRPKSPQNSPKIGGCLKRSYLSGQNWFPRDLEMVVELRRCWTKQTCAESNWSGSLSRKSMSTQIVPSSYQSELHRFHWN